MNILVIGGGNMGKTFAESFLNAHIIRKDQLHILEKDKLRVEMLNQYNIGVAHYETGDYIREMDIIILAVKPQDIQTLYPLIQPYLHPEQIVLSIMAGIKMESIQRSLGAERIVRAMPNLPCQVGMGVTAYTASPKVPSKDIAFIQLLLETTGLAIQLSREEMLDAITAVSGSGPAYVFYFMDAMITAARQMGFTQEEATQLTTQTFLGSIELFNKNTISCEQWIERVASKGGTTEAALKVFNAHEVKDGIIEGLHSAQKRGVELSKNG